MQNILVLLTLIIGTSGLIAQTLLLRELLISFYGNELTLGIILSNWMILEATGALLVGKFIERIKNKTNILVLLQVLFSITLPFSIYFSRIYKPLFGVPFGEGISLLAIFLSSFIIILPSAITHGGLFSCICKIFSMNFKDPSGSIGKAYSIETIGSIIAGLALTYFFIPYCNSFQIVFILAIGNLTMCLFFFKLIPRPTRYLTLTCLTGLLFPLLLQGNIQQDSIKREWRANHVLEYKNSLYGNITVIEKNNQYSFFYNGLPSITTPVPDKQFVEEFGNLPLLFHQQPQNILIIGSGAGGLINQVLDEQVKYVDYLELDPLLITLLKKYPSKITMREFSDPRVNIINLDAKSFLKNTLRKYDVILIGSGEPSDLNSNRLFTQEFFSLAKQRLNFGGILSLHLPGSETYLSDELKNLNACILNGLRNSFQYFRVIPGDYNLVLACDSHDLSRINPLDISERISQRNIRETILIPSYIEYRLNPRRENWFMQIIKSAKIKTNLDFRPVALFEILNLWNAKFAGNFSHYFSLLKNLRLADALIIIAMITFFFLLGIKLKKPSKISINYCIFTTGFFAMLVNLILLFLFQINFGYLYYKIGLLIGIFMLGVASGSMVFTKGGHILKKSLLLLGIVEGTIILFLLILEICLNSLASQNYSFIFMFLFFISGALLGAEFPLAVQIFLIKKGTLGETIGTLYFFDLLGGWLAGILGGIVFLPILGIASSCNLMIFLKLSSLLILILSFRGTFSGKNPLT